MRRTDAEKGYVSRFMGIMDESIRDSIKILFNGRLSYFRDVYMRNLLHPAEFSRILQGYRGSIIPKIEAVEEAHEVVLRELDLTIEQVLTMETREVFFQTAERIFRDARREESPLDYLEKHMAPTIRYYNHLYSKKLIVDKKTGPRAFF